MQCDTWDGIGVTSDTQTAGKTYRIRRAKTHHQISIFHRLVGARLRGLMLARTARRAVRANFDLGTALSQRDHLVKRIVIEPPDRTAGSVGSKRRQIHLTTKSNDCGISFDNHRMEKISDYRHFQRKVAGSAIG
jgi:hypothetical protein